MAEITEAQVYEALGLPVPEGVRAQDIADPAVQTSPAETETGAQEQEVADPAPDIVDADPLEAAPQDDGDDAGEDKPPLTEQERKANAARRRQQEMQAAIDQAVENALKAEREKNDRQMQGFFAQAGLKNPTTGEPITTMEQFEEWRKAHVDAQLQRDLKEGNLTQEMLQQLMDNHPVIQQAQQMLDQQQAADKVRQESEDKARMDAELARITALDPSIKSFADLLTMPKADVFRTYVNKGYSFEDSFRLTHYDRLQQQQVEAAKQQALNNARSKDHLQAVGSGRGEGMVDVPADVLSFYRAINPRATDAEIQAHYNKNRKK